MERNRKKKKSKRLWKEKNDSFCVRWNENWVGKSVFTDYAGIIKEKLSLQSARNYSHDLIRKIMPPLEKFFLPFFTSLALARWGKENLDIFIKKKNSSLKTTRKNYVLVKFMFKFYVEKIFTDRKKSLTQQDT